MTILLAEHRLERCLPSADRVLALRDGRLAHDGSPDSFLGWAVREEPALQTPGARMFALAGFSPAAGRRQAGACKPACTTPVVVGVCILPRAPCRSSCKHGQPQAGGTFLRPSIRARRSGAAIARRVARAPPRPRDPARRRVAVATRRKRRPDGAQRRRQVHAAASRRRPHGAHPRADRARRARRAAAAEPRRLLHARARRARGLPPCARARRPRRARGAQPPRPLRWGAPAPGARDRHRRGRGAGGAGARRAHARHGPAREGTARRGAAPPRRAWHRP